MINTHLKFEGKIDYGSKVVAFKMNYTRFKANLILKIKVKISNPSEIFRWLMNSFSLKVKFQMNQF